MINKSFSELSAVIIGAGNVATHLAHALAERCHVAQIYSHTATNAALLAQSIGCRNYTADLGCITADADLYIISVKDDAIEAVVAAIPDNGALWLHTSGSKSINVFAEHRSQYGVIYPMQSFVKQIPVDFSKVPFFIEGSNDAATALTEQLAHALSEHVYHADSETRCRLHIAAVLCCNFPNHLWALAYDVLKPAGIPFNVMLPLIQTSVDKLSHVAPAETQTGPAIRRDYEILSKHLAMLSGDTHTIYDILSQSIINHHT